MVIEEEEEKCRSDNDGEGVTVEWQTEETRNCVATSDEAPGTMNTTPFCTTPQGAVFGAPIQTQEQSMQLPYPVDDLVRIHPKLFADPYDLAAMITLYVECLPSRLVEGMEVWRSALATLPRNGGANLCMPETSVDLVLQSSEEVTCLRFTSFQLTGGVLSVHGEVGAYFATLDHLFTHWHKVWQLVRQRSQDEVVCLFSLLTRTVSGQTDDESVQDIHDELVKINVARSPLPSF
ncbi:hypothetical protein SprV_0602190200 [Sparganum proliferum]